jgi:putative nucleotidyltransferase with HDIG domain
MTARSQPWSDWIRSNEWRGSSDTSMPILPAAASDIITIVVDSEVTVAQISHIVSKDPVLATRVLRMANSAYCAPPQGVATIKEAIVRMGTAAVRNMVLAACLASRGRDPRVYGVRGRDEFDHAIGTAYTAYFVADLIGSSPDEGFLAGLVHDIGKLLLLKLAYDYGRWRGTPVDRAEIEEVIATEHASVGAGLLSRWRIPPTVHESVMWHHEPEAAPHYPRQAELVYVADRLSHRYAFGCERDERLLLEDPRCARLSISDEWIEMADSRVPALYAMARQILSAN